MYFLMRKVKVEDKIRFIRIGVGVGEVGIVFLMEVFREGMIVFFCYF